MTDMPITLYPGSSITILAAEPLPPPPPPPDPNAMPTGDLPGWKLIFSDDFLTPVPLGKFPDAVYSPKFFCYKDGWKDTTGHGTYMPSRVLSVHDSVLDFYIHSEGSTIMVATVCPTIHPGAPQTGQLYGRHAFRFRVLDPVPGYKGVPLLWPDPKQTAGKWSPLGELDFPEASFDKVMYAYTHFAGGTAPNDQQSFNSMIPICSGWHIADVLWEPTSVSYILDGIPIGKSTSRIPNVPMHIDLQFETDTSGVVPNITDATHVEIDWIAIWAYNPTT